MLIENKIPNKPIQTPDDIADILRSILKAEHEIDQSKEHFWAIGLTTANNIAYIELVTLGILNASLVAPREIYGMAIRKRICSIITAHNHPSGRINPSSEDLRVIKQLYDSGNILGIKMLDHIIIAGDSHWSAEDNGILKQ